MLNKQQELNSLRTEYDYLVREKEEILEIWHKNEKFEFIPPVTFDNNLETDSQGGVQKPKTSRKASLDLESVTPKTTKHQKVEFWPKQAF